MATANVGSSGIAILVQAATSVPKMDLVGHSDTFVRVEVFVGNEKRPRTSVRTTVVAQARAARSRLRQDGTPNSDRSDVSWEETLHLGNLDDVNRDRTCVRFTVRDQDMLVAGFIGEATITMAELVRKPTHILLLQVRNGNPVVHWRSPPTPCELRIALVHDSLPSSWPKPEPASPCSLPLTTATLSTPTPLFPRHILMMSRGTRGDVQPFVALARGLARWSRTMSRPPARRRAGCVRAACGLRAGCVRAACGLRAGCMRAACGLRAGCCVRAA